jgi:hypothetical protein
MTLLPNSNTTITLGTCRRNSRYPLLFYLHQGRGGLDTPKSANKHGHLNSHSRTVTAEQSQPNSHSRDSFTYYTQLLDATISNPFPPSLIQTPSLFIASFFAFLCTSFAPLTLLYPSTTQPILPVPHLTQANPFPSSMIVDYKERKQQRRDEEITHYTTLVTLH